jgi:hypothetical protein
VIPQSALLADQIPRQLSFKHTVQIRIAWQQRGGDPQDAVCVNLGCSHLLQDLALACAPDGWSTCPQTPPQGVSVAHQAKATCRRRHPEKRATEEATLIAQGSGVGVMP